jgi:hypothetical protein
MDTALDDLARAIRERQAILFAGAGLSMSVGLPSWRELIERLGEELGVTDPKMFEATGYQTLAEYYRIRHGSIGPIRSWMDRNWNVEPDKVRESELHRAIVALDFPILYTTNYDRNLEVAYEVNGRDYVKIANAREIAKAREGVPQIVKFHGDFDDDSSLVLTETDYFERLTFDSPLDVKFRADALGKTVLFVGYSMTDLNIRLLLHRLWRSWRESGYERDRPRSFVFLTEGVEVQEAVLGQWGLSVIGGNRDAPERGLTAFLAELARKVERAGEERTEAAPEATSEAPGG